MVFKMITSGEHVKKINGKFFKDQKFNLDVNPYGKKRIFLKTQELDDGNRKIYKNAFNSMDDFMRDFHNNNNSLFELNKNISRPRYISPKYIKIRQGSRQGLRHGLRQGSRHGLRHGSRQGLRQGLRHKKIKQRTYKKKGYAKKK